MENNKTNGDAVVTHFDQLSKSGEWSRLYKDWDGSTYHFQIRRERVLELLPAKLGKVLDLGCGPGVMVKAVLEREGTFHGIDLSPEMVNEAQDKFGHLPNVSFRVGSGEALDIPDGSFDQVICMAVVEYLDTPAKMLSEINRVLTPGGLALITVPKRRHIDHLMVGITKPIRSVAKYFLDRQSDDLPRLCLQPEELDAAAKEAGLDFVAGRQYQFTPIPYPVTRIAPTVSMNLNLRFENWTETRNSALSFFGHGYIGLYKKASSI